MTLDQSYFDRLYQRHRDPWGFRTRWYETRKRQLTLAALPDEHYGTIFEPGCSIGLLTADLAARGSRVLAMDISTHALDQAAVNRPDNVELRRGSVPSEWPSGRFDLVVLSEVGYYLDAADCDLLADLAVTSARDVLAVHWRHPVHDYPLTGDEVHQAIERAAQRHGLARLGHHLEADFTLSVWSADHRSVASRAGLLRS